MNIADYDPVLWQAIQDENRRQEEHIELIASENYASPRVMEAQGSQMWADHIDAWTKKISAVGTGNVHIESPKDNLTAYAERAEYMQTPGVNDGIINLFDNVYATQNGSSLNGDNLQIRLADNSAQAMSRSTLIIMPQNN